MNKQTNEIGMGLAAYLLSLTTIMVLTSGKVFRDKEINAIIHDSREYLKGPGFLAGSPDILRAAEDALRGAEQVLRRVLAPSA